MFQRATKRNAKIRMALIGPAGSGKTYTALRIARALVGPTGRIALVDTEHGSASHYADTFEFDTVELNRYDPAKLIELIKLAEESGYDCLIVDSLSHFWYGEGGELDMVEAITARSKSGNSFTAWRYVTPVHNKLVDTILTSRIHQIHTMRSKTEWSVQQGPDGKVVPRKIGLAPIMREGIDYEFDVVAELSVDNNGFAVTKSRCQELTGFHGYKVGEEVAEILKRWLVSDDHVRAADGQHEKPQPAKPQTAAHHPPATKESQPQSRESRPQHERHDGPQDTQQRQHKPVGEHNQQQQSQASPNAITVNQQRLVWAKARAAGLTQEQVAEILGRYGVKRTADIPRDKLDEILAAITEAGNELARQETEEVLPPWV